MRKKIIITIILTIVIITGLLYIHFSTSINHRPTTTHYFIDYDIFKENTDLPIISRLDDEGTVVKSVYIDKAVSPYKFYRGKINGAKVLQYCILIESIEINVYQLSAFPNRKETTISADQIIEDVIIENIDMHIVYNDDANILSIRHIFTDYDVSVSVSISNTEGIDKDLFIQDNRNTLITIMSEFINVIIN